jgi:hypothetical protein
MRLLSVPSQPQADGFTMFARVPSMYVIASLYLPAQCPVDDIIVFALVLSEYAILFCWPYHIIMMLSLFACIFRKFVIPTYVCPIFNFLLAPIFSSARMYHYSILTIQMLSFLLTLFTLFRL